MTRIKIDLLMENLLSENPVQLFNPTKDDATAFASELESGINAPHVDVSLGQIGKPDRVYLRVSLQPKDKWPNGYFQNSIYFQMHISYDGAMEVFTSNLTVKSKNPMYAYERIPIKFRKTKAKTAQDAINKINAFSKQIKDYYASIDLPIEESSGLSLTSVLKSIKEGDTTQDLGKGLEDYIKKLNDHSKERFEKGGYTIESDVYEVMPGKRWNKIAVRNLGGKGQRSVFCFVDTNGDIYKPAGWNAPAKGVRGNIYDQNPPLEGRDLYKNKI